MYVPVDLTLPPADRAVKYLLDRIQVDPDLMERIGPRTVAFSLLVDAESDRINQPVLEVARLRTDDLRVNRGPGEIEVLRAEVKRLKAIVER